MSDDFCTNCHDLTGVNDGLRDRIAELEAERDQLEHEVDNCDRAVLAEQVDSMATRITELEATATRRLKELTTVRLRRQWEQDIRRTSMAELTEENADLRALYAQAQQKLEFWLENERQVQAELDAATRPDDVVIIDGKPWRVVRFDLGVRPFYAWGEFVPVEDTYES